jgi:hypothetical protein
MKSKNIKFLIFLGLLLIIFFGAHLLALYYLNKDIFENQIISSYLVNFSLAVFVFLVVIKKLSNNSAQAGFVFMGGSALKFLVFFLVFYPSYKEDGNIETLEFLAFFIPYQPV